MPFSIDTEHLLWVNMLGNIWCDKHSNYIASQNADGHHVMHNAIQYLCDVPMFQSLCGYVPGETSASYSNIPDAIEQIVNEFGGICCFIGDGVLAVLTFQTCYQDDTPPEWWWTRQMQEM